jgi:hypothetical protein
MSTRLEPAFYNHEQEHEINVIILYDDLAAGRWAGEVFSSVGESQSGDLHFHLQPWRLDFLSDPDWTNVATAEAAGTQLLVLSMSHSSSLTSTIENWLRAWLHDKHGTDAALVVLADDAEEEYSDGASHIAFLKDAATKAGVNFFSVRPPAHDSLQCFTPSPPQAFSFRSPYRHWGLNE